MDIPRVETQRSGFGSSKVLAPDFRKVRPAPCKPVVYEEITAKDAAGRHGHVVGDAIDLDRPGGPLVNQR